MILDQLDNHRLYPFGDAWQVAFDFLLSLNADAEEKRYALQGDDIYAAIESYDTQLPCSKLPEAHRKYVDIQVLLDGTERIAWHPFDALTVSKPYASDADIAFFDRPESLGTALDLEPGLFAVFFPGDAHTPGLQIDGPSRVKKVVVKIAASLLT
jgi:biofilm protein TabA